MNEIEPIDNKKLQAMENAGVSRKLAYSTMYNHLTAMKKEFTTDEFGIQTEIEVPDYPVQEKALEKALRVMGDLKPDIAVDNRKVVINTSGVTGEVLEGLLGMVADVRKQLSGLKASGSQTGEIIDI